MKHKRKKVLLSSVAMLLVALVALGSATYAWFTIQRTVTANTMQVTATAQKGIEITKDAQTYSTATQSFTAASYEANPISWASDMTKTSFVPAGEVTAADGTYSGTYKVGASVPAAVTTAGTENKTNADNFTIYRVGVRSAANTQGNRTAYDLKAAITVTGDAANYARVALYDETAGAILATYGNTANASNTAITAAAGTTATVALKGSAAETTGLTATDTTATGKFFQLIIWFEGTDADCYDLNADKAVNVSIDFTAVDQ